MEIDEVNTSAMVQQVQATSFFPGGIQLLMKQVKCHGMAGTC